MSEIPAWKLEAFVLGELPRAEQDALVAEMASDPRLKARVEALEASNREILLSHPPRLAASVVRARLARDARPSWPRGALAAAAMLAIVVAAGVLLPGTRPETADETRVKGLRPRLALFRQTPSGAEPLDEGARAKEGDLVQLAYQAAGRPYGVIVSIDGRGVVTLHHPRDARAAARLDPGRSRLATSYRLDDAPGWERFVLVTSRQPFDVAPVVRAAETVAERRVAAEPLPLPSTLEQFSFTLSKEDRR